MGSRHLAVAATLALVVGLTASTASAAILKNSVRTGSVSPSVATTNVALTGVDITKAFVVCSSRTANSVSRVAFASCQLDNGGPGGAAQLTIALGAAPAAGEFTVQYYVAEFEAGVSVQRGSSTLANGVVTAGPTISSVDCSKTFLITSTRNTLNSSDADEATLLRAQLVCSGGTATALDLDRLESPNATVVSEWQVVTYEGASVQRGLVCIGSNAACPRGTGATSGRNNRVTLGTSVDTTKSLLLLTRQGNTGIAGLETYYMIRGRFVNTGASVNLLEFSRATTSTATNLRVDVSWEVVSFSDGTSVQTSATPLTFGTAVGTQNITTVDTTRVVPFHSWQLDSSDTGNNQRVDETSTTVVVNGANGSGASSLSFERDAITIVEDPSIAWFAVSFFRCNPGSGVAHDTLCGAAASAAGTTATVNWSSINPVLVVGSTTAVTFTPTNGTNYAAGFTSGDDSVVYSGTVATDTSLTAGGLVVGTTYHYKIWAKAGPGGACTTAPCYVGGTAGTVTPRANTLWSSLNIGGAALNPAVAGTDRMSFGSNAGRLITVNTTNGAWSAVPGNTVSPVQGYVSVYPVSGGEAVVGGDQSGFVYSVDPVTGSVDWVRKMNADAIQAPVSTYLRGFFGLNAGMATAYPGSYDVVFVATMNNTAAGGFTNNKVFALRSDTGAVLWTFSPATLTAAPCPAGCPMDQVLGQPWVDYERARLYVASRDGSANNQGSLWVLDLLNNGALLNRYTGADFTTGPVQSGDLNSLFIGDEAGVLHILDLNTMVKTTNTVASGSAFRGIVWEDFTTAGRLYFVRANGFVSALATPTSSSFAWNVRPVATGTVSALLPGTSVMWVGGSNGTLYQLDLGNGAVDRSLAVGSGSLALGPVSTDFTVGAVYVSASDGTVYKIGLTGEDIP
jgi:hypothetical protein